jgi:hypothetical protein
MSKKIKESTTHIDFCKFPEAGPNMEIFLEALQIQPSITSVSIPQLKKKGWELIAQFLHTNTSLQHIMVHETMDSSFKTVIDDLTTNKKSNVSSVSFVSTEIKGSDALLLQRFFGLGRLTTLTLINAVTSSHFTKVLSQLTNEPGFSKVESVRLEGFKGLNAEDHFALIPGATSVGLKNCEANVARVVARLPPGLTALEVDGGVARTAESSRIPALLSEVTFTGVLWGADVLFFPRTALLFPRTALFFPRTVWRRRRGGCTGRGRWRRAAGGSRGSAGSTESGSGVAAPGAPGAASREAAGLARARREAASPPSAKTARPRGRRPPPRLSTPRLHLERHQLEHPPPLHLER